MSVVSAGDAAVCSVVDADDAAALQAGFLCRFTLLPCSVVNADDAATMQAGFLFRFTLLLVSCSCS